MGFADKVTTALAKPASPRSDGKEKLGVSWRIFGAQEVLHEIARFVTQ